MFHRGIRYAGEGAGVPGAPGNLLAGGNFMGGAGSAINPEAFKKDARQQKIYKKGQGTDNLNEREIFLRRTGPQLPLAQGFGSLPGAIGNMGGVANAFEEMNREALRKSFQREQENLMEDINNRLSPAFNNPFNFNVPPVGFHGKYVS